MRFRWVGNNIEDLKYNESQYLTCYEGAKSEWLYEFDFGKFGIHQVTTKNDGTIIDWIQVGSLETIDMPEPLQFDTVKCDFRDLEKTMKKANAKKEYIAKQKLLLDITCDAFEHMLDNDLDEVDL